jgi:hypothetical protein
MRHINTGIRHMKILGNETRNTGKRDRKYWEMRHIFPYKYLIYISKIEHNKKLFKLVKKLETTTTHLLLFVPFNMKVIHE